MPWPIQFAKEPKTPYNFLDSSFAINAIGNGAVAIVGGIVLGTLAQVALKALGFTQIADVIALAIPVTLGAFGVVAIAIGCGLIAISIHFLVSR